MKYNKPRKNMKSRWSIKYKKSINCSNPKGFSQKNYCKRKKRGGRYLESFSEWLKNRLNENENLFFNIRISLGEKDAADWALEAMEEAKEELFGEEVDLPKIEGDFLFIPKNKDVIEDMLYRLTTQVNDMFKLIPKDHEDYDADFIKSSKTLSNKLKKLI